MLAIVPLVIDIVNIILSMLNNDDTVIRHGDASVWHLLYGQECRKSLQAGSIDSLICCVCACVCVQGYVQGYVHT